MNLINKFNEYTNYDITLNELVNWITSNYHVSNDYATNLIIQYRQEYITIETLENKLNNAFNEMNN